MYLTVICTFLFIPGESKGAALRNPCSNSCCLKKMTQNMRLHPNQGTSLKEPGVQKTDRVMESSRGVGYSSDTLKWAGLIFKIPADAGG